MILTSSKRLTIIIIFITLLSLIITITASADEPEVYVDDDFDEMTSGWNVTHFNDIQSGINNIEENGTLYISSGSYSGEVYVNKSITIIGENVHNVIVSGQFYVESNNAIIEQLTIRDVSGGDFPAAIVDDSSNSTYRNLRLINNTHGIEFYGDSFGAIIDNNIFEGNINGVYSYYTSSHAIITNNTFENNINNGIYLSNSDYFTIANNYILNTSEIGLTLSSSSHNLIYNNYFDNSFNSDVDGGTNNSFNMSKKNGTNIIGGDYLAGNYWSDYTGMDVDGDGLGDTYYEIAAEVAYDDHPLVFTHLYVDDDADSTWYDTNHVHTISEAIDNSSSFGAIINVYNGTYNESIYVDKIVSIIGESIAGVYVTNEWSDTFYIDSPGVILANMTIADNAGGEGPTAAIFDYNTNATYSNLHILNNIYGIRLSDSSSRAIIQDCIIENNSYAGIYMAFSDNHVILNNFIIDNSIGIRHADSEQNLIFNNYFSNTQNVNITVVDSYYSTSWNISKTPGENIIGGPYLGGNYWSDYTGIDTDADGIGETNHSLGFIGDYDYYVGAHDYLPLTWINYPPIFSNPKPLNGSSNQPLNLDWSIQINDSEGIFDWFISCSNGQNAHSFEDSNGTKTLELSNLAYGSSYTISVNVYDYYQWTNETFYFITKNSPPPKPKTNTRPVAIIEGGNSGFPGESIEFDGSNSYDHDGTISSYSWNFGDGTSAQGATVSHSYTNTGTYTVSLTVTDNKGKTDSTSTTVSIIKPNYPPELSLSLDSSPGELIISLTVFVSDEDGDPVSCSINWGDGSSPTSFVGNNDQYTFSHAFMAYGSYDLFVTGNDGTVESSASTSLTISDEGHNYTNQSFQGFSQFVNNKDSFLDNQIDDRSFFGNLIRKDCAILAGTVTSIILLFLLNLIVEFLSDYSSERIIEYRKGKKGKKAVKKTKDTKSSIFLSKKEILAVIISSIVLSLVLTWTWAPDLAFFWETFAIVLAIVLVITVLKEVLRGYLSHKKEFHSEYYIWPLGIGMMFVSTFLGNTFSLSANHHYDEKTDIKKCGKVSFIVSIVLYAVLLSSFLINLYYPSAILQMITIVSVLNLFIDLFPLSPMDGHEIRHWNFLLWAVLYVIVTLSYIVVYFNIFP